MSGELAPSALQARPLPFPIPSSHLECEPGVHQVLTARVATVLRLAGLMRRGPLRDRMLEAGLGLSRALLDVTIVLD